MTGYVAGLDPVRAGSMDNKALIASGIHSLIGYTKTDTGTDQRFQAFDFGVFSLLSACILVGCASTELFIVGVNVWHG